MGDMMTFPKRWEDFLHDYEFEDARRIYTNGSRLIPSFRVEEMMEHYAPVVHAKWDANGRCTNCRNQAFNESADNDCDFDMDTPFCPWCGAKMDGEGV